MRPGLPECVLVTKGYHVSSQLSGGQLETKTFVYILEVYTEIQYCGLTLEFRPKDQQK
jgi:hypothetical protein